MVLGTVLGTVWGSVAAPGLAGLKLAIIRPVDGGPEVTAVDRLGADVGQQVIVGNGSRVRDVVLDDRTPIKTVVLGIVDGVERA